MRGFFFRKTLTKTDTILDVCLAFIDLSCCFESLMLFVFNGSPTLESPESAAVQRGNNSTYQGLTPESQSQNLASAVLYVPY